MRSSEQRPRLLGRRRECAALDDLVARARSGSSGVLVLEGEPGIGKSALLEHLVESVPGYLVLRASGVELEMELPYAGLQRLCAPLLHLLETLPSPQGAALATAFGLQEGPPPSRFLVGLAVLSLLAHASESQPLLCVVDDAQWLDTATAQTVAFVARRLLAERIVVVLGSRILTEGDALTGLPTLSVRGLADHDAAKLLSKAVVGPLENQVRNRLLRETRGNPLAVLELGGELNSTELMFGFTAAAREPLATRIEERYWRRLQRLPEATQRLLLIAAAEPSGDAALVWRAACHLGLDVSSAAVPAFEAGLVADYVRVGAEIRFRHPLVRSAVYRTARPGEIRKVHGALAIVTDPDSAPDRKTWHLAQATTGHDEDVAAALEACAARAQARGGLAAAAAFLERATELTGDAQVRTRRALAAAWLKHEAGAPAEALSLLSVAEAGPLASLDRAVVHLTRAQIAFLSEHSGDAPEMLLAAARELEPLDATLSRRTYLEALTAAVFAGRLATGTGLAEVATMALAAPAAQEVANPCDLLLDGLAMVISEGYSAGAPVLRDAVSKFRATDMPVLESLRWLWLATHAAHDIWDEQGWEDLCDRQVGLARQFGALHVLPIALSARIGLHLFAGELSTADVLVQEAASVTEATGSSLPPYGAIALTAWRGRPEEALPQIDTAIDGVLHRGDGMGLTLIRHAQAVLYNGLGRYPEALTAAIEGAKHPAELAFASWSLIELVEAAVLSDNRARASRAVEDLAKITEPSGTDWALGVLARCRALLADDPRVAEPLYREAIERLTRTRLPMVLARAHLVYGEWLQQEDRRPEAREQLRTAQNLFMRMGAEAFAERARAKLAATGESVRQSAPSKPAEGLTAQEAQVARFAATGMTNPECGAQLFISARTVEWHLRKVYAKLGISSRKELGDALSSRGFAVAR